MGRALLGHLGGSQGTWGGLGVLGGGSQVSGMSLGGPSPLVLQGLGMWGTPWVRCWGAQGGCWGRVAPLCATLCHAMPVQCWYPAGPRRCLLMPFPPTSHLFPKLTLFHPIEAAF